MVKVQNVLMGLLFILFGCYLLATEGYDSILLEQSGVKTEYNYIYKYSRLTCGGKVGILCELGIVKPKNAVYSYKIFYEGNTKNIDSLKLLDERSDNYLYYLPKNPNVISIVKDGYVKGKALIILSIFLLLAGFFCLYKEIKNTSPKKNA
jgi:hypothetical protein